MGQSCAPLAEAPCTPRSCKRKTIFPPDPAFEDAQPDASDSLSPTSFNIKVEETHQQDVQDGTAQQKQPLIPGLVLLKESEVDSTGKSTAQSDEQETPRFDMEEGDAEDVLSDVASQTNERASVIFQDHANVDEEGSVVDAESECEKTSCGGSSASSGTSERRGPRLSLHPRRRARMSSNKRATVCTMLMESSALHSQATQLAIDNHLPITKVYHLKSRVRFSGTTLGAIRRAESKATKAVRAIKTLSKSQKDNRKGLADQIAVVRTFDHPNILMVREIFEDESNLYLVMDAYLGPCLQQRLVTAGTRNLIGEVQSALVMRQVLRAISYMHESFICHRDMAPQNILFKTAKPIDTTTLVKVAALRSPFFFQGRKTKLTAQFGNPAYMCPEMKNKSYTKACDLWSCGVVLFEMLCGSLPFDPAAKVTTSKSPRNEITPRLDPTLQSMRSCISRGVVAFAQHLEVSEDGRDLVENLVRDDPKARFNAYQALHHKWMKKAAPKLSYVALPVEVVEQLKAFRSLNKFKQVSLRLIASILSEEETASGRKIFMSMDLDGDGDLSTDEFKKRIQEDPVLLAHFGHEVDVIFRDVNAVEKNAEKGFTYTEFLAATFDRQRSLTDETLKAAFVCFDRNGDGYVSISELSIGFGLEAMSLEELGHMLEDVDQNNDNSIDFKEFRKMLRGA